LHQKFACGLWISPLRHAGLTITGILAPRLRPVDQRRHMADMCSAASRLHRRPDLGPLPLYEAAVDPNALPYLTKIGYC